MPFKNKTKEEALKQFQEIPSVGKQVALDFWDLGFNKPKQLIGHNPEKLYLQLCTLKGIQVDLCMLYVFRCAIYYVSNLKHDPALLNWWA
jgi:hypothetical protein